MKAIKEMLSVLPETTVIAITPDTIYHSSIPMNIQMETVELKTKDIVNSFMYLQTEALKNINAIQDAEKRNRAYALIRRMSYFK